MSADPVDNVRASLTRVRFLKGEALEQEAGSIESDLADLLERVRRVRGLSARFGQVELSPQVRAMMRLAERQSIAV
jgi:hypothetical protein